MNLFLIDTHTQNYNIATYNQNRPFCSPIWAILLFNLGDFANQFRPNCRTKETQFNPNRSLLSLTDLVRLPGRCADVSSKTWRATARCNDNADVCNRTKAVGKQAGNSKSKQIRSDERLGSI